MRIGLCLRQRGTSFPSTAGGSRVLEAVTPEEVMHKKEGVYKKPSANFWPGQKRMYIDCMERVSGLTDVSQMLRGKIRKQIPCPWQGQSHPTPPSPSQMILKWSPH